MAEDVFLADACVLCDDLQEGSLRLDAAEQWQHVGLHVPGIALVDLAVLMDRDVRDHEKVAVHVDEHGFEAVAVAHRQAPRHGKRPVEPGGADHAAVRLHVQLDVAVLHDDLGILLDLEGGGVGMCREDAEIFSFFRDGEDHDRGVVPCEEIGLIVAELPGSVLPEFFRAVLQKTGAEFRDRLESCRCFFDEIQQFSVHVLLLVP